MFELDVRVLPPSRKHATIRERLEVLPSGQTLQLINDHDPRPLRYELDDLYPGAFAWTYVECGPALWRVDIAKRSETAATPQIDIVADCHALQVGGLRVKAGGSQAFETLPVAAAVIFHEGEGTITVAGCSHGIARGTVELVCPGESCTISATKDIHAFVVFSKEDGSAQ